MLKTTKKYLLSILCLLSTQAHANVIIVHGSFSEHRSWFQEDGDFYEALKSSMSKKAGIIVPFKWSGELAAIKRAEAAIDLCNLIINQNNKSHYLTIIGHSHGGNVINLSSQLLSIAQDLFYFSRRRKIRNLCKELEAVEAQEIELFRSKLNTIGFKDEFLKGLSFPVAKINKPFKTSTTNIFQKILNEVTSYIQSGIQAINSIMTMPLINQDENHNNLITILETSVKDIRSKHKGSSITIDESYLLACPVNETCYAPNEQIIKKTLSLYSKSDKIQTVSGLFKRTYSERNDIKNINVIFRKSPSTKRMYMPGHNTISSKIVGKWILKLPELSSEIDTPEFTSIFHSDFSKPELTPEEPVKHISLLDSFFSL